MRVSAVVGALVLAATTLVATPAAAAPDPKPTDPKGSSATGSQTKTPVPGGFATWADLYAYQQQLNQAATAILKAGGSGNASIVAAPEKRALQVYWYGDIPAKVQQTAQGFRVPVSFRAAAFPHSQLAAEANRLANTGTVVEASPAADGSGIAVVVPTKLSATAMSSLRASSAVPLTVTTGQRPQPMYSRQADVPSFWGGSRFSAGSQCTNGFPIQTVGQYSSDMVTAGHCGNNGDAVYISGRNGIQGQFLNKDTCRDTAVIHYGYGVSPSVYTGAYDSSSSAQVVDVGYDYVGNWVATSGASSGEHTDLVVTATDTGTNVDGISGCGVGPVTKAQSSSGGCAVAPGDSGGPVYEYSGVAVIARGVITSGYNGTATCPGVVTSGSNTVFYAPLRRPYNDYNIGGLLDVYNSYELQTCAYCAVIVPDVYGLSPDDATATLQAYGLNAAIYGVESCFGYGIIGQFPAAGSRVGYQASIGLYWALNTNPSSCA